METIPNKKQSYFRQPSPVLTVFTNEPLLSLEDKLLALETLQLSLDLKKLMDNFAALVARFIRPFNISFQSAYGCISVSASQEINFTRNFNLGEAGLSTRLGTMTYQSKTQFTIYDDKLLTELHQLLKPTLQHALKHSKLNSMVYKDHLTNIGNRAYYEQTIFHAIEQSNRTNSSLSLMILDIDKFKPINDTYGHIKGDQILNDFAKVLTNSIRTSDIAFRLGGDEFAIVLYPSSPCSIEKIQLRINEEIDKMMSLKEVNFSASMGFSHWEIGINATQLFELADKKLYENKALRNNQR